jgi:hypothetical protein
MIYFYSSFAGFPCLPSSLLNPCKRGLFVQAVNLQMMKGTDAMKKYTLLLVLISLLLSSCEPSDTRPGFWLSGEVEAFPPDWTFTDDFKQIALQVATPYGLPHSITIWCVQVDGSLYIAARAPESKRWPGWVEDDPAVLLKIGERLFEGQLQKLNDTGGITAVGDAYMTKYQLKTSLASTEGPGSWFWLVRAR